MFGMRVFGREHGRKILLSLAFASLALPACGTNGPGTAEPEPAPAVVQSAITFAQVKSYGEIIKTAYGIATGFLEFVGVIPSLADKLDGVKEEILADLRQRHEDTVVSLADSLMTRFGEIARNPTNPTFLDRYASWLDDSSDLVSILQTDLAKTDPNVLYPAATPYNVIAALRVAMLRGKVDLSIPAFDTESVDKVMRAIRQNNYNLVGSQVAFRDGDRERWIDTTRRSKLWQTKFSIEGSGSCGAPNPLTTISCNLNGNFCKDAFHFGTCTDSCDRGGCVDRCIDIISHSENSRYTNCYKAKLSAASAKMEADAVVMVIREAQNGLFGIFEDTVDDAAFGAVVPARRTPVFENDPIAAASARAGRLDVYFRGTDQALWHAASIDGQAWAQQSLGGTIIGGPTAASRVFTTTFGVPNKDHLEVFARGIFNGVHRKSRTASIVPLSGDPLAERWSDWEALDGATVERPALVTGRPSRVAVVTTDPTRVPQVDSLDGANWTGWRGWSGRMLQSTPSALSWGGDRLDVFGVSLDGSLRHAWGAVSGGGGSSESLGGVIGQPAAVSWGDGRLDIVALGADSTAFHIAFNGTTWEPYLPIGGTGTSNIAVVSWGPGRLDVFMRSLDSALWHNWCSGTCGEGTWGKWESLGGILRGTPVVTSWGPNRLDIFVVGGNNFIYHKAWNGQTWVPSQTEYEFVGGPVDAVN